MEISHFSHKKHSLILCDKKKIHGANCAGCKLPVRGPAYECAICNFCLHKVCALLPQKVQHPLHPPHPLTLLSKSPNESGKFTCRACHESCSGFNFHCEDCKFDLDIECALEAPELHNQNDGVHILHVSHKHPLTLSDMKGYGVQCSGCQLYIGDLAYACAECEFFLHESCSKLPEVIRHDSDATSTFILVPYCGTVFICQACKTDQYGFMYTRHSGGMAIDVECATLKPSLKVDEHKHSLTYFEKEVRGLKCNACGSRCHSQIFRCVKCNFNLHYYCAPVLGTIKLDCHTHPLTLTKFINQDETKEYHCHVCENRRSPNRFSYYCAECKFATHIDCVISEAVPPSLSRQEGETDPPEQNGVLHSTLDPFLARFDDDIEELNEEVETLSARQEDLKVKRLQYVESIDPAGLAKMDEEIAEIQDEIKELAARMKKLRIERQAYEYQSSMVRFSASPGSRGQHIAASPELIYVSNY